MRTKSSVRHAPGFLSRLALFLMLFPGLSCAAVLESHLVKEMEAFFLEIESVFDSITAGNAIRSSKSRAVARYLEDALQTRPAFYSLLRADAKGVAVARTIRGKGQMTQPQNISKAGWFMAVSGNQAPYYGVETPGDSALMLLWCRPVIIGQVPNARFAGALALEIDFQALMSSFAAGHGTPFKILLDNKAVFSHNWDKALNTANAPVSIPGMDGAILYFDARYDTQKAGSITGLAVPDSSKKADSNNQTDVASALNSSVKDTSHPPMGQSAGPALEYQKAESGTTASAIALPPAPLQQPYHLKFFTPIIIVLIILGAILLFFILALLMHYKPAK